MKFASDCLAAERRGHIAILRLNRPEKRNAVNDALIADIRRFFDGLEDEVRAVVLCGTGKHFSAGLDLAEHKDRKPFEGVHHSRFWHETLDRVQFGGRPVITAMQGAVIGGGLEIATATHVRVAERSCFYQLPEGRRGIFVGGGASVRVSRIIGVGRMVEMMLTGRTYDAEDGLRLGLSHYLVDEGQAFDKAMELADTIAGNAPISNYMMLQAISRISDMSMSDGLFTESLATALSQTSEDSRRGIEAFLSKRQIRFDKDQQK